MLNSVCKKRARSVELVMKYAWDAFELRGSEVSPEMLDKTYQICSRLNQKVLSLSHFMINLTLLFNNFDCVKKKRSFLSSRAHCDENVQIAAWEFLRLKCAGLDFLRFPHHSGVGHISGPRYSRVQEMSHLYYVPVVLDGHLFLIIWLPKTSTHVSEEFQMDKCALL